MRPSQTSCHSFYCCYFFPAQPVCPPATRMNVNSMSAANHKSTLPEKHQTWYKSAEPPHPHRKSESESLTSLNSPWSALWLWYLRNRGVVSAVRYNKLGFYKLGLSGCYCHIINSRSPLHLGLLTPRSLELSTFSDCTWERPILRTKQRQMYKSWPVMFSHHVYTEKHRC